MSETKQTMTPRQYGGVLEEMAEAYATHLPQGILDDLMEQLGAVWAPICGVSDLADDEQDDRLRRSEEAFEAIPGHMQVFVAVLAAQALIARFVAQDAPVRVQLIEDETRSMK